MQKQRIELSRWTSPPLISIYLAIVAAVAAVGYTLLSYLESSGFGYSGSFFWVVGGCFTLIVIAFLLILFITSLRIYQQARISEYLVFSLMFLTFLTFTFISIIAAIWGELLYQYWTTVNPDPLLYEEWVGGPISFFHLETSLSFLNPGSIGGVGQRTPEKIALFMSAGEVDFSFDLYSMFYFYIVQFVNIFGPLIIMLIFISYFMRMIWISIPKKYKITGSAFVGFFVCSYYFLIFFQLEFFPLIYLLSIGSILLTSLLSLYAFYYLGIKIYRSIDPPHPTSRILMAAKLWRIIFCLCFWYCSSAIITLPITLFFGFLVGTTNPGGLFWSLMLLGTYFPLIIMSIILGLFCIISLRYPEGLLIFETHLFRAKKIYQQLDVEMGEKSVTHPLSRQLRTIFRVFPQIFL